jgi:hypothetical protein
MPLLFTYRLDSYLDKRTLMTKRTCWIIMIWFWPLFDLDRQGQNTEICLNCHNFVIHLLIWIILAQKNICANKIDKMINSNLTSPFNWHWPSRTNMKNGFYFLRRYYWRRRWAASSYMECFLFLPMEGAVIISS